MMDNVVFVGTVGPNGRIGLQSLSSAQAMHE